MPPVASAATGATAHNVINAIISQHLARCYAYFGRAGARRKRAGWVLEFGFGRYTPPFQANARRLRCPSLRRVLRKVPVTYFG